MRPRFHFTPAVGWINDPHGITYRDGGYEVFYQYVPDSTGWQPHCHWGHARGADMLSLKELPFAIAPGDGDGGIWTGSLVVDQARGAHIFYTATSLPDLGRGRVRSAMPTDDGWIGWRKGPVVVEAPADLDLIAFRDPFVRQEGESWRMFVGAAGRDGTAMALTYVSDDLTNWRYDGVALSRSKHETDPVWTGGLWECPQVFELDGRFVMVFSVWDEDVTHYAAYALGSYADGRFQAESWGRLTYGPGYYAPSLYFDDQQRPCLSFWLRDVANLEAGWAGAHSVPHLLSIDGDFLVAAPHPDVDRYHGRQAQPADSLGDAVDIFWSPGDGDVLTLLRGTALLATLTATRTHVRVEVGDSVETLARGAEIRVLVDGPVLELATGRVNFGTAIAAAGGQLSAGAAGASPRIRELTSPD